MIYGIFQDFQCTADQHYLNMWQTFDHNLQQTVCHHQLAEMPKDECTAVSYHG